MLNEKMRPCFEYVFQTVSVQKKKIDTIADTALLSDISISKLSAVPV